MRILLQKPLQVVNRFPQVKDNNFYDFREMHSKNSKKMKKLKMEFTNQNQIWLIC
jgi:hypothetical protein